MEDAIYQDVITLPDGRIAVAHERYDASGVLVGKEYIPQPRLQNPTTATPYSKKGVLTDATCELLKIPAVSVPNDAFHAIATKQNPMSAYSSDLYMYISGTHPVLCANPLSDYMKVKTEHLFKNKDYALTGNAQTITIKERI